MVSPYDLRVPNWYYKHDLDLAELSSVPLFPQEQDIFFCSSSITKAISYLIFYEVELY